MKATAPNSGSNRQWGGIQMRKLLAQAAAVDSELQPSISTPSTRQRLRPSLRESGFLAAVGAAAGAANLERARVQASSTASASSSFSSAAKAEQAKSSTLDDELNKAMHARENGKRALEGVEDHLSEMFKDTGGLHRHAKPTVPEHDASCASLFELASCSCASGTRLDSRVYASERHAARAVLLGPKQALTKLIAATEALEVQAARALAKQRTDAEDLLRAGNASIEGMHAEREGLVACLVAELDDAETDAEFSVSALLHQLKLRDETLAARSAELKTRDARIMQLRGELSEALSREKTDEEARLKLKQEIEELHLRLDTDRQESERIITSLGAQHEAELKSMRQEYDSRTNKLDARRMDKQKQMDAQLALQKQQIEDIARNGREAQERLSTQLNEVQLEKAVRERRLREEQSALREAKEQQVRKAKQREAELAREKDEERRALEREKEALEAEKKNEAARLHIKINKMRRLQQAALPLVGEIDALEQLVTRDTTVQASSSSGDRVRTVRGGGTRRPGSAAPSTGQMVRARQLLYSSGVEPPKGRG